MNYDLNRLANIGKAFCAKEGQDEYVLFKTRTELELNWTINVSTVCL